ncbi:MAG: methylenetetrahydrofolate reductase C-terminal domain-containing protein [Phycisphaerae bacterium]|nr:methylenetetrahydrofolate reductase C-terminal domain-containing protein [Phycisphaerae bacterium]
MIVADRKPMEEILAMLAPYKRVLVLACGGCVTVCVSGGEKQADLLASQLKLAAAAAGRADVQFDVDCITRQCDREFAAMLKKPLDQYDAVLSIACGVGVGFMSELAPQATVLPGLNTTSYDASTAKGVWQEYCGGCGDCLLAETGGICPIVRCSKGLTNGTCGGTKTGKCEVSKDMDCGWYLIFKKLQAAGKLELYTKVRPAKKWSKDRNGKGARRLTHKELMETEEFSK